MLMPGRGVLDSQPPSEQIIYLCITADGRTPLLFQACSMHPGMKYLATGGMARRPGWGVPRQGCPPLQPL